MTPSPVKLLRQETTFNVLSTEGQALAQVPAVVHSSKPSARPSKRDANGEELEVVNVKKRIRLNGPAGQDVLGLLGFSSEKTEMELDELPPPIEKSTVPKLEPLSQLQPPRKLAEGRKSSFNVSSTNRTISKVTAPVFSDLDKPLKDSVADDSGFQTASSPKSGPAGLPSTNLLPKDLLTRSDIPIGFDNEGAPEAPKMLFRNSKIWLCGSYSAATGAAEALKSAGAAHVWISEDVLEEAETTADWIVVPFLK